ncbi:putative ORFan [Tupanvirus deep ocean]|uniref:ORFan n=2 Tax=Tupanvirus TaxID=2094720 RepID=A0AC62AA50_9VIRU|nr:putative ORFan [Tupanvirus deep ocean]QKU34594.1 putative ORFan [Tupanvirus deep ocean]
MDQYTKLSAGVSKLQSDLLKDILSFGFMVGVIIGIIGFALLLIELGTLYKIYTIDKWPVIKNGAIIRDSYMENTSGSTTYSIFVVSEAYYNLYYRTRASFVYKINGKTYVGNKISFNEPWEANPMIAKIESDVLVKGAKVDIRVNPYDPSEAYIYNKSYRNYGLLFVGLVLSFIGIYVIIKS